MKYLRPIIFAALLVIIDQLTKLAAIANLKGDETGIILIPSVLRLFYLENYGSAFGMLQNQRVFFIILTAIILIGIIWVYSKLPDTGRIIPLRIVLIVLSAGAIGNLIDRIIHIYVVDFIYFELINFPVFNVADIYVTLSVFTLLYLMFFFYKDEEFEEIFGKKKN